jgi:hypothetical protein
MQSEELCELTANERLTLEEEYIMQRDPLPLWGLDLKLHEVIWT